MTNPVSTYAFLTSRAAPRAQCLQPGHWKSPKSTMVTEASKGPRIFHSRVVEGTEGVESGEGVSEGVDVAAGTRVLVGIGRAVAVGSMGSGEEEQAQDMTARAAAANRKRVILGKVVMSGGVGSEARINCH